MRNILAMLFMIAGTSGVAMATQEHVPEINPTTAIGALTLLGGSVLVLRARMKR